MKPEPEKDLTELVAENYLAEATLLRNHAELTGDTRYNRIAEIREKHAQEMRDLRLQIQRMREEYERTGILPELD